MRSPARPVIASLVVGAAVLVTTAHGRAAEQPPPEGPKAAWHPRYGVELEAHGTIAAFDRYFVGLGAGARASIPVWKETPFKGFDNDLGVGIGFDTVRYGAYKPSDPYDPTVTTIAYYVPLYAQWNVWLGARASLFVEPTVLYRYASYLDPCGISAKPCGPTTRFLPTGSLGLRFRVADTISGTLRVGWPMATLGASWL
ncbi:MAG: hypothetical protein HYV09_05120 [Deltaproteobacteria bacterium]|nr:hypothetical protein [Deltaproteobacteria bacterium]